ncbi:MAG: Lrp/AsnC family transcriptional regulator [Mycobacterium sp.]
MHSDELSELDLALVNALQIAPRVSWSQAGRILGTSAQTLAARWDRLRCSGAAWVTVHPGGAYRDHVTALVEVDCGTAQLDRIVRDFCADPRVVTVEESTQGYALLLTVMTADMGQMSEFLVDHLGAMSGIVRRRTYLATAVHHDGSAWRLDVLDKSQRRSFESLAGVSRPTGVPAVVKNAWPMIEALAVDGRRTAADIAEHTGRNPATVRRTLPRLLASGMVSVRCEIAQSASRRPLSCTWRGRIAADDEARTVAALRTLPNLRLCMSTTGDANLLITVWTANLAEILTTERLLGAKLPWLDLRDSGINLRTTKRLGWLLDRDGRATGQIVIPNALQGR